MSPVLFAAATLLAQAPAAAPAVPSEARTTEVAPVTVQGKERDPLVCKSSQPLGSKVPKRTCMKKSEIAQVRAESREIVEDMQRRTEPFYRAKEP